MDRTPAEDPSAWVSPDLPSECAILAMLLAHRRRWVSAGALEAYCGLTLSDDIEALQALGCKISVRARWHSYWGAEEIWVRLDAAPKNLLPLACEEAPSWVFQKAKRV